MVKQSVRERDDQKHGDKDETCFPVTPKPTCENGECARADIRKQNKSWIERAHAEHNDRAKIEKNDRRVGE